MTDIDTLKSKPKTHRTAVVHGTSQAWLEQAAWGEPSRTMLAAKTSD